jgi:hypothetical protein
VICSDTPQDHRDDVAGLPEIFAWYAHHDGTNPPETSAQSQRRQPSLAFKLKSPLLESTLFMLR